MFCVNGPADPGSLPLQGPVGPAAIRGAAKTTTNNFSLWAGQHEDLGQKYTIKLGTQGVLRVHCIIHNLLLLTRAHSGVCKGVVQIHYY